MLCSVEFCGRWAITRGWCQKHYFRWRRTGDPEKLLRVYRDPPLPSSTPKRERWEAKIDKSGECWIWTGSRGFYGYGQLRTGHSGVLERAHRLAWEFFRGPIPNGLFVLHRCDSPPCVNPDHLWLGTQRDNLRDCATKGRIRGGRPKATASAP
jgi:hypothetical protein